MSHVLDPIRQGFTHRIRAPRAWSWIAFTADRLGVAMALALAGPVILVAAAWTAPETVGRALTDGPSVQSAFARFVSAVATASAIAISVTTLTLSRELRGVQKQRERFAMDLDLRDHVEERLPTQDLPLDVHGFVACTLDAVRGGVHAVQAAVDDASRGVRVHDVALHEYLAVLDAAAERAAARIRVTSARRADLLEPVLDFEHIVTMHFVRRFARHPDVSSPVQDALDDLRERVEDAAIAKSYASSLDTQFGLTRMVVVILSSTIPAILAAAAMVLAYGSGVPATWGVPGAALVVAAALGVVMFPIAAFVSYLLRHVFVNSYSLPTAGFLLGPEAPDAASHARRHEAAARSRADP